MSIDQQILAAVQERPRQLSELLGELAEHPERSVRMRVGYLCSRGRLALRGDTYHLHNGAGRPRKKRAKLEVAEPEAFDVAVWLDGSVCIRGATASADGSMVIQAEDAVRMARHILKLPTPQPTAE